MSSRDAKSMKETSAPLRHSGGFFVLRVVFLAAAYFAGAWLGLKLAPPEPAISLIWLPTGIAVAALFRWGLNHWPGITLAAVILQEFSFGMSWPAAGVVVAGQTLGPVVAVALLRKLRFRPEFTRRRDILFFLLSGVAGMLLSATSGCLGLIIGGVIPGQEFLAAWSTWYLGDLMGVLLAGPVLISLRKSILQTLLDKNREFVIWLVASCAVMIAVYFLPGHSGIRYLPLVFLPLIFMIWAAMRLGISGASLGILLLSILSSSATATGHGPFVQVEVLQGVFLLWAYLGTAALVMLMITAIEIGRCHAELRLLAVNRELESALSEARELKSKADIASGQKSGFLARLSHEIRNPLSGVLGMAGLLQESNLDPQDREYVDLIKNSGESMLELLNDILDFSKIEAGQLKLKWERFPLSTFLEESTAVLRIISRSKNLTLVLENETPPDLEIECDKARVRQILLNLLGNAVKFSTGGQIVLRVSMAPDAESMLLFEISDTGPGIPPDQLEQLFQPFFQVDSPSVQAAGTGLGLAISKQLVEMLGGQIGVRNYADGAVFWFQLPVARVHPSPVDNEDELQ